MSKTLTAPRKKSHILVQSFDVCFIMVLCFATLLATMKIHGKVLVGGGGTENLEHGLKPSILLIVGAIFVIYLWYMLRHSERELREIVHHVYGKEPADKPEPADPSDDAGKDHP